MTTCWSFSVCLWLSHSSITLVFGDSRFFLNFNSSVFYIWFNSLFQNFTCNSLGFSGGSGGKEYACSVGDMDLIPGLGRSRGGGNSNPLWYSFLENSMDWGTWWYYYYLQFMRSQRVRHNWLTNTSYFQFFTLSVQLSRSVLSDSLRPHGLQHARPPCITNCRSSLKLTSIESVMPFSHLILCRPLLLLPSIPPSIRVFSNELTLHMRWPNVGVSALASVLPMNTQHWSPLGWTGWTSLQSKGLSR